jgi:hypothetical protein
MPSAEERTRLIALGADVEVLWHHPRKRRETQAYLANDDRRDRGQDRR